MEEGEGSYPMVKCGLVLTRLIFFQEPLRVSEVDYLTSVQQVIFDYFKTPFLGKIKLQLTYLTWQCGSNITHSEIPIQ